MLIWTRRFLAVLLLVLFAVTLQAQGIDRRKDQFPSEFGYLIFPLPYSLPGIGEGWLIPVALNNMLGTYADTYLVLLTGDASGYVANLEDVHLISKRLIARVYFQDLTQVTYRNYTLRGMSTGKDDYQLLELSSVGGTLGEVLLTFWDRRFELYVNSYEQPVKATAIRDSQGNIIAQFSPPLELKFSQTIQGVLFDLTDDKYDPRRGLRLRVEYQAVPRKEAYDPDYTVFQWGLTGYIPLGKLSTLALHAFRSDANVTSPGDLDPVTVAQRTGIVCAPADVACQGALAIQVNDTILHNRNGASTPLGGQNLLRGYSDARFRGAHTLYYGAEFRWNLTEEFTPFDYFIWKDVRTNVQLVLFHEQGSVSETADTLGNEVRTDSGAGVRMVSASGTVYRADYAVGDEGPNVTMIINYPF